MIENSCVIKCIGKAFDLDSSIVNQIALSIDINCSLSGLNLFQTISIIKELNNRNIYCISNQKLHIVIDNSLSYHCILNSNNIYYCPIRKYISLFPSDYLLLYTIDIDTYYYFIEKHNINTIQKWCNSNSKKRVSKNKVSNWFKSKDKYILDFAKNYILSNR